MHVLPLCDAHHQGVKGSGVPSVHPWKKRWELEYGKQDELVAQQWADMGVEYIPYGQRQPRAATSPRKSSPRKKPEKKAPLRRTESKVQRQAIPSAIPGKKKQTMKEYLAANPAAQREKERQAEVARDYRKAQREDQKKRLAENPVFQREKELRLQRESEFRKVQRQSRKKQGKRNVASG